MRIPWFEKLILLEPLGPSPEAVLENKPAVARWLTGSAVAQNEHVRVVAALPIPLKESRTSKGVLAADELSLSRRLIDALERENAALRSRLDTERSANAILLELNETRKSESDALRETVKAKNKTIAAKDSAIVAQDKLIAGLRTKPISIWKTHR